MYSQEAIIHIVTIIFWVGVAILFYSYLGYGLLLWCWQWIRKTTGSLKPINESERTFCPPVTLIIPAYNEEDFIEQKIQNTLSLEYPEGQLHVIVVTDGSTDRTNDIVAGFPSIQLIAAATRSGKTAAIHKAMEAVRTEYVVFSDANSLLNPASIRNLVRHYQDPGIGGVAGEKKIIDPEGSLAGQGEGLYWKYESFLKQLDAAFYTVVGAAGELYSIRTRLYQFPGPDTVLDDFVISMRVCLQDFRVAYEPAAFAMEAPSMSISEERKRKVRISAGAFQAMGMLPALFNIFRHARLSFQYLSHRVLRWTLCPLLLPVLLLTNVWIVLTDPGNIFRVFLGAQLLFYFLATAGWLFFSGKSRVKLFFVPYYFTFINLSLFSGLVQYMRGQHNAIWEKARRQTLKV